jgi:N-acetyltransferase
LLSPFVLESARVRLEPLTLEHAGPLAAAAAEDRTRYQFTWVPDGVDDARRYVTSALAGQADGRMLPFAVRRRADDRIVGSTRFLDLDVFGAMPPPWPPGVGRGPEPADDLPPSVAEIGSTWYAAPCQRTGINTACKLLLLGHAFEVWETLRVTLKTDARNAASRRAIERLGGVPEGVRRAHTPASDGTIRDTAYYSIVAAEWPDVRDRLTAALTSGALHSQETRQSAEGLARP